jgi:hypothetical protein
MSISQMSKQLEASGDNQIQIIISRDGTGMATLEDPLNTAERTENSLEYQRTAAFSQAIEKHIDRCQGIWAGAMCLDSLYILLERFPGRTLGLVDFEACHLEPMSMDDDRLFIKPTPEEYIYSPLPRPHTQLSGFWDVTVLGNQIYKHSLRVWLPLIANLTSIFIGRSSLLGTCADQRPKMSLAALVDQLSQLGKLTHLTLSCLRFQDRSPLPYLRSGMPHHTDDARKKGVIYTWRRLLYFGFEDIEPWVVACLLPIGSQSLEEISLTKCRLPSYSVEPYWRTYSKKLLLKDIEDGYGSMADFLSRFIISELHVFRCPSFTSKTLGTMAITSRRICPGLSIISLQEMMVSIPVLKTLVVARKAAHEEYMAAQAIIRQRRANGTYIRTRGRPINITLNHLAHPSTLQVMWFGFSSNVSDEDRESLLEKGFCVDLGQETNSRYAGYRMGDPSVPPARVLHIYPVPT